eukprot:5142790-Pyramimonas_sp.AAC.1
MTNEVASIPEHMKPVPAALKEFTTTASGARGAIVTTEILKQFKVQPSYQSKEAMGDNDRTTKVTFAINANPCFRAGPLKEK